MSDKPEPQKYSVEQMLDRVKGDTLPERPDEEVLPDGRVRVRRRKRRSRQPIYAKRRKTRFLLLGGVLALLLVLAAIAYSWWKMQSHYKTKDFASAVSGGFQTASGLPLEIEGFSVDGDQFYCQKVELPTQNLSPVGSFSLRGLGGSIGLGERFSREWSPEDLKAEEGTIVLRTASSGEEGNRPPDGSVLHMNAAQGLESFGLGRLQVEKLDLLWGEAEGIFGTGATFVHLGGSEWRIHLGGGELRISGWKSMTLSYANLLLEADGLRVEGAGFGPDSEERAFGAEGFLHYLPSPASELKVKVDSLPSHSLLSDPWKGFLAGNLSGNLIYRPTETEGALLSGEWTLSDYSLERLPFWRILPRRIRDQHGPGARDVTPARASFSCNRNHFSLSQIHLGEEGVAQLRGELRWTPDDEGSCSGKMEAGLPVEMMRSLPEALKALFTQAGSGFTNWSSFEISGSLSEPSQSLISRMGDALEGEE